jgi:hypothetical protein
MEKKCSEKSLLTTFLGPSITFSSQKKVDYFFVNYVDFQLRITQAHCILEAWLRDFW